ncbi:MAG: hypothetical protein KGH72_03420 [Candidatus Micrarchaeota archaeon]|nr:hypothetical protein [Candidatus Micrarchaeota archaeon]
MSIRYYRSGGFGIRKRSPVASATEEPAKPLVDSIRKCAPSIVAKAETTEVPIKSEKELRADLKAAKKELRRAKSQHDSTAVQQANQEIIAIRKRIEMAKEVAKLRAVREQQQEIRERQEAEKIRVREAAEQDEARRRGIGVDDIRLEKRLKEVRETLYAASRELGIAERSNDEEGIVNARATIIKMQGILRAHDHDIKRIARGVISDAELERRREANSVMESIMEYNARNGQGSSSTSTTPAPTPKPDPPGSYHPFYGPNYNADGTAKGYPTGSI